MGLEDQKIAKKAVFNFVIFEFFGLLCTSCKKFGLERRVFGLKLVIIIKKEERFE